MLFSALVSAEYWPVKLDILNDSARFIPLDNVLAFERAKVAMELDIFQQAPSSSSNSQIVRIYEKIKKISAEIDVVWIPSAAYDAYLESSNPTANKAKARFDYGIYKSFIRFLDNREDDFGSNRIQYTRFGEGSVSAMDFVPILNLFFRSIDEEKKIYLSHEKDKLYRCGIDLANNCLEKCNSCEESQIYRSMISEGLAAFQDDNYVVYYPYRSGSYRAYGLSALKSPKTNLLYKTFMMMKQVPQYALIDAQHVFVRPGEIESSNPRKTLVNFYYEFEPNSIPKVDSQIQFPVDDI